MFKANILLMIIISLVSAATTIIIKPLLLSIISPFSFQIYIIILNHVSIYCFLTIYSQKAQIWNFVWMLLLDAVRSCDVDLADLSHRARELIFDEYRTDEFTRRHLASLALLMVTVTWPFFSLAPSITMTPGWLRTFHDTLCYIAFIDDYINITVLIAMYVIVISCYFALLYAKCCIDC